VSQKLLNLFGQLKSTSEHSTMGKLCVVKTNIVLSPNFVTKNLEQTVIQGMASDKSLLHSQQSTTHFFKFSGRASLTILVLRTPALALRTPKGYV